MSTYDVRFSNPPGLWDKGRLSQVVEVQGARIVYLSGQAPVDAGYRVPSGDFAEQAHLVFDNIEIALASVGGSLANVVKTTTYLVDEAHVLPLREVRAQRLKALASKPANTLLVVKRLAEAEFLVEIDVVAALPIR